MNYASIPPAILSSLERYRLHGVPTGGALRAILSNDLKGAFRSADEYTLAAMREIVSYVVNELPMVAQGSEAKVDAWIEFKRSEREVREDSSYVN